MNDNLAAKLVIINGRTYSLHISADKNLEIIPQFSPFKSEHLLDVQELVSQHAFNNISVTVKEAHQTALSLRAGMFAAQRDAQIIFRMVGGELVPQTPRAEYLFESLPQGAAPRIPHHPVKDLPQSTSESVDNNNARAESFAVAR